MRPPSSDLPFDNNQKQLTCNSFSWMMWKLWKFDILWHTLQTLAWNNLPYMINYHFKISLFSPIVQARVLKVYPLPLISNLDHSTTIVDPSVSDQTSMLSNIKQGRLSISIPISKSTIFN